MSLIVVPGCCGEVLIVRTKTKRNRLSSNWVLICQATVNWQSKKKQKARPLHHKKPKKGPKDHWNFVFKPYLHLLQVHAKAWKTAHSGPIPSFPILIDSRSLLQVFQHALFIFLTFTSTASGSLGLDGLGTYKVFVLESLHQNRHPKLAKLKNKKNSLKNKKKNKKVTKTKQNLVGGFSPPIWKIWYRQIGSWNPKDTGWKVQKSLSCHHLERSREFSKKSNWAPLHLHLSCSLPRSWALRSNTSNGDVWSK